jgi:hypothetical protein
MNVISERESVYIIDIPVDLERKEKNLRGKK